MRKSDLLAALEAESETLQNITDYFVSIMANFHIYFFWEQEPTVLPGPLGVRAVRDFVVPKESAAPLHDDTERAGIPADHRGMVKFEDPTAQGFRLVVDALLRYCDEAPAVIERRLHDAARALEEERRREAAETVRAYQRSVAPHATPPRIPSGLDGFSVFGRSSTFRSLGAPGESQRM